MENKFRNKYTAIVCVNNDYAIGKDGKLLYRIKADLWNFKSLTTDNVVIMGRSTFESLGCKPLKDRVNIILTNQIDFKVDSGDENEFLNTYICNSFEEVDNLCYAYFSDKELFIIGGGSVYKQAFDLGIIDKAIVTLVNDVQEGDTYFPRIDEDDRYKLVFKTTSLRDYSDDIYYRYLIYKRKQ